MYERVGISLVEVYERVEESVTSVDKIAPACLTGTFYAGFLIYSYTVEPPLRTVPTNGKYFFPDNDYVRQVDHIRGY